MMVWLKCTYRHERNHDSLLGGLVLRAATVADKMVREVMGWAVCMPPFASSLTGVVENILGRVQDAFFTNITQTLGNTISGKYALNQEMALLMSLESDAELIAGRSPLLEYHLMTGRCVDPARFYIVSAGEPLDPSACPSPFSPGSIESELAEREVLSAVLHEVPIAVDSLLARPGHFWRLVTLASLSGSLDFIAKCVLEISNASEVIGSPTNSAEPFRTSARTRRHQRRSSGIGNWEGLSTSLSMIIDRYRSLSGKLDCFL